MPMYDLPKAHPIRWVDEERALLYLNIVVVVLDLPSVRQLLGEPQPSAERSKQSSPRDEQDKARSIAQAYFTHYPQLETSPRVYLGISVVHPLIVNMSQGLMDKPPEKMVNTLDRNDLVAFQVGLAIRRAGILIARIYNEESQGIAFDEHPKIQKVLDKLHDYLANAAVYFYHLEAIELHRYLADRQLLDLQL